MTFEEGEIGAIHVNDDCRRQGIATGLLKHGDKVAGQTLIDDGQRTLEGSRLLTSLGRKKAPFVKRASRADVLRAVRGICWNYLFAPADKMNVVEI